MAKRDFGINPSVAGRSYSQDEAELNFGVIRKVALAADNYGFSSISVPDHLLNPVGSAPGGKVKPDRFRYGIFEAWTTISSLATITSRARLTNSVLCNLYRYPAVLAQMASTLDHISNGRLNLALGAGWFKTEFMAYGIPWVPYGTRLEMLRESIRLIKKLWTDEEVTFSGKYYHIEKCMLRPKPVQKPHPPIVVGGSSENVMRIAVEEADGWDVDTGVCSFELFQQRMAAMEKYCSEMGRSVKSIRISVNSTPIFARSASEAKKMATIWAKRAGVKPDDYISNKSVFLGTAEDIVSSAEKWFESGANQVNFMMPQDAEYAQNFCEEVARLSR